MVEFIVLYGIDSDDVLRFLLLPLFLPMILTSSMWFAYDTVLHLLNGTNEIQIERFKWEMYQTKGKINCSIHGIWSK